METETISYEEKEQQLVNDCVKELRTSHVLFPVKQYVVEALLAPRFILRRLFLFAGDANLQISSLAEELARKTEDATRQQEEITHLLSQIVDLQKKAKLVWKFVMFRFSQTSYHIMTYKYQQI